MTTKKKCSLGCSLSSLLEDTHIPSSIDSLLKTNTLDSSLSSPHTSSLSLSQDVDLESLVDLIDSTTQEDAMEHFIDKYSSPNYNSLDELIAKQGTTFVANYTPTSPRSTTDLFSDLDDLFNEN